MSEGKYHDKYSCNICQGENEILDFYLDGGYISECETKCTRCGHKDYWVTGFFESSHYIKGNCKKY